MERVEAKEQPAKRHRGKTWSQDTVNSVIKMYLALSAKKYTIHVADPEKKRIREVIAEVLGVGVRKVKEVITEYKRTKEIPKPKDGKHTKKHVCKGSEISEELGVCR